MAKAKETLEIGSPVVLFLHSVQHAAVIAAACEDGESFDVLAQSGMPGGAEFLKHGVKRARPGFNAAGAHFEPWFMTPADAAEHNGKAPEAPAPASESK